MSRFRTIKLFQSLPLLLGALFLSVLPADAAGQGAQIIELSGSIEALEPGHTTWQKTSLHQVLSAGAELRTGPSDSCRLVTPEGHELRVRADTQIKLSSVGEDTEIALTIGVLRSKVAKLQKNQKYGVRTPTAVAAVRGTRFDVLVSRGGATEVRVFEGIVNFREVKGLGAGEGVEIMRNQRSVVQPGAAPKPPEPLPSNMTGKDREDSAQNPEDSSRKKQSSGPTPPGGGSGPSNPQGGMKQGGQQPSQAGTGSLSQISKGGSQQTSGGSVSTTGGSSANSGGGSSTYVSSGQSGSSGGHSANSQNDSGKYSKNDQTVVSGDSTNDPTLGKTLDALNASWKSANLNSLLATTNVQSLFQEGLVQKTPDGNLRLAGTSVGKTGANTIVYVNASKKAGQQDLSYQKVDLTFNNNIPSDYTQATSQALRSLNGSGTAPTYFLTSVATERGHTVDYNVFDKLNVSATGGVSSFNTSANEWRTVFGNAQASITPANGAKTILYNKVTNSDGTTAVAYLGGSAPSMRTDAVDGGFSIRNTYADGTRITQTVTHFDSSGNTVSLSNVPAGTSSLSYLKSVYALDGISCSQFKGGPIENMSTMNARISGGLESVLSDMDAVSVLSGNAPVSVPTGVLTTSP